MRPLGDKVVGVFDCTKCGTKLEVQVKDCVTGRATDYGGDTDSYVGFTCEVCGDFQTSQKISFDLVEQYHKTAKAIEAREKQKAKESLGGTK